MTKPQFGRSWIAMGVFVGAIGVMVGACSKTEDSTSGEDSTGGTGSGTTSATGSTNATAGNTSASTATAAGGTTSTTSATAATGNVPACQGIPAIDDAGGAASGGESGTGFCSGQVIESEATPTDMVILMDKSVSNSYAIGSTTTNAALPGETSRWDVMTAGMQAIATSSLATKVKASLTFFPVDGTETVQCTSSNYEKTVVDFDWLNVSGPRMVTAMNAIGEPSGMTPLLPAVEGALTKAMAFKATNGARDVVLVLVGDGFPTICDLQPANVAAAIKDAATAPIPIRTFVIGIGNLDAASIDSMNVKNYASSGGTGSPFLIDETQDATGVQQQVTDALLNISNHPLTCEYDLVPPEGMTIDPDFFTIKFQPASGGLQELPKVAGLSGCSKSANGGFYFDNATAPTKATVCPCNCSAFGAGKVQLVYGCKPQLIFQ